MSRPSAHVGEIDQLRGIAILLTFLAHLSAFCPSFPALLGRVYAVAEFWGGVYLFFVISGYVITRGFGADFAPPADFTLAWKRFYLRRFFRIVPASLCWIVIVLALTLLLNSHGSFGELRRNLVQAGFAALFSYNLIFPLWTAAFGIYWSLALEEQFYLLFPLLSRVPLRRRLALLVAPIILLSYAHRPAGQLMVFLPVDALCWGVLLALAEREPWYQRLEPRWMRHPARRLAAQAAALLALVLIPAWLKPLAPATSLMELVCVLMVFSASFDRGYAVPPLGGAVRAVGLVSFSAYLAHMPAFLAARELALTLGAELGRGGQNLLAAGLAAVLTLGFTLLSYRLVEVPMRRQGRLRAERMMVRRSTS